MLSTKKSHSRLLSYLGGKGRKKWCFGFANSLTKLGLAFESGAKEMCLKITIIK
jgi:hypothetical protein